MSEEAVLESTDSTPVEGVVNTPVESGTVNFAELINSDGSFKDEFYSALPDDLGSHSSVQQMKNITDLAKSYQNTKGLVGKKLEEFWTSDDPSIMAKRKEVMGVPDSAEGYDIQLPEMPEGVPYDETALNDFKGIASELGITKEQAAKLVEWDAGRATKAFEGISEQVKQTTAQAEESLRKEWGTKYDYNLSKIEQAVDYLGVRDEINNLGLGANPTYLKMILEKIVPAISNDKLVENAQQDNLATLSDSLNDIESKLMKYDGNPRDPEYLAMVKTRTQLLQKLA